MTTKGQSISVWSEQFPPAPQWTAKDIPDLSGKVCAVTGGYGGIGYETTKALLQHSAKVYILGRTRSKFDDCLSRLSSFTSNKPIFIPCDLASKASSKSAGKQLLSLEPTVHVLFCSAGVSWLPYNSKSDDGYEMVFHANVIGHYILLESLREALERGYDQSGNKGRVIWTGSYGMLSAPKGGIVFESLKSDAKGMVGAGLYRQPIYGQSKLAMVVLAQEVKRRYGDKILAFSLNPGNIRTDLTQHIHANEWRIASWFVSMIERYICYDVELGAITQLYAGTSKDLEDCNGVYLVPFARVSSDPGRTECTDADLGSKLWDWLEKECEM
ncbi:MAG: hypothetical protein TREMPRED_005277 [Tremellales sp. Tagirdzhanova-0007]|nr:MAG: hypothetical protein TREMPRED_005277 [Tremellales sp. Tagirdzhanova-0007]